MSNTDPDERSPEEQYGHTEAAHYGSGGQSASGSPPPQRHADEKVEPCESGSRDQKIQTSGADEAWRRQVQFGGAAGFAASKRPHSVRDEGREPRGEYEHSDE